MRALPDRHKIRNFMIIKYFMVSFAIMLSACSTVSAPPVIERNAGTQGTASSSAAKPIQPPAPRPAASVPRGGGYYKDDGPGESPPTDLDKLADAKPRIEPLHRFANNPYNVFGQEYVPMKTLAPFRQSGIASWYGKKFHGERTSSGEIYDMYGMTAAHPTLPIPSYVRVSNQQNGRSVIVRVNDRGPFHAARVIDLSFAAAFKLGYAISGSTTVQVELLQSDEIASLAAKGSIKQDPVATLAAEVTPVSAAEQPATVQPERAAIPAERVAGVVETPPAKTTPPASAATTGVYLQLGAFSSRENAESFRARVYREVGWLNDSIEILPRDGLFRLQLGPYRDREQAGGMAERLRRDIELKPVFVSR